MLAEITQIQREVFEFGAAPTGWWRLLGLALLALLGYGVIEMYRREGRVGAPLRLRLVLGSLRCAVLGLLALVALEPLFVTYVERTFPAQVAVLIDDSASMRTSDGGATSRTERVAELLTTDDHAWLRALAANNDVALYRFGGTAARQPLPWNAEPNDATVTLDAARTNLGGALQTALSEVGAQRSAGVIVLTDGVINAGLTPDELSDFLQRQRTRLHLVGVGRPVEPPNLRITNLAVPSTVPLGDPFELRVDLALAGAPSAAAELTLTQASADATDANTPQTLATERLTLAAGEDATIRIPLDPTDAGDYLYRAALAPLADEAFIDDNTRAAVVRVIDQQLRVLIVAGRPTFEYRYLTRLLERDRTIDVSCWLQSADARAVRDGDTIITSLPREPERLFEYDAILLLDPDPAEFDSAWSLAVRRWVDEFGGGLLYQAGPQFASRFFREQRLTDLVGILPITPDPDADVRLSESGAYQTEARRLRITDAGRGHPLLTMHPDPDVSAAVWPALPSVWWSFPVRRTKPLATPLLIAEGGGRQSELLATQPFGGGRTAYLGADSTWRWRSRAEPVFNRFWVQTVRYLAYARRQSTSNRGMIVLQRETLDVGDDLIIEARLLDESFVPWHADEVAAQVRLGDAPPTSLTLDALPGREGWFGGRLTIAEPGAGRVDITVPASRADGEPETLVRHFRVRQSDVELQQLRLAVADLQMLAERSAGTYRPLADAATLPAEIESAAETRVDRGGERPLWDKWWVLAAIAGLLAIEWSLRRRNYLL